MKWNWLFDLLLYLFVAAMVALTVWLLSTPSNMVCR